MNHLPNHQQLQLNQDEANKAKSTQPTPCITMLLGIPMYLPYIQQPGQQMAGLLAC
jgi:hypothetical protein